MAFSSTTIRRGQRVGSKQACFFTGTAGASGNTVVVGFTVRHIIGAPDTMTFTQSQGTVTFTAGITNTRIYHLIFLS